MLRFAAAGGVLFSHTADLLFPRSSVVWAVPWNAGVDLFFVISGFIMTWLTYGQFGQRHAAPRYLARRIIRIVPPYWFFTILMILTVLLFGKYVRNTTLEPIHIATSFGFIPWPRHDGALNPILSQGWTLNYEAFFYVCFAAALVSRRGLALLVVGFCCLSSIHPLVPDDWFVLRFYSDPIILEFVGGIGLALLYLRGWRLPRAASLAGVAAAVAAYVTMVALGESARLLQFGLPALLLAAGVILAPEADRPGPIRRFLIFGGDASYTLYLSHTFTVNAAVILWRGAGGGSPVLVLVGAMVLAIALAMLFYRIVEAPVTSRLGRIAELPVARGPASVAP